MGSAEGEIITFIPTPFLLEIVMSLIFEQFNTDGIAQLSYLVGDSSSGHAAIIDPRRDVDIYLERARHNQLAITHIFETHNHADFVSGARELHARVPDAGVYLSESGGTRYAFDHETVSHGDTFEFGSTIMKACHTPGHTPEHQSYMLVDSSAEAAWGICSGDSLFVGSAGRPDLMGDNAGDLAKKLHETLYQFYMGLDDNVLLYPGHGAGSACGANIGDRPVSSIGYERRHNSFLQFDDYEAFKEFVINGAPPAPAHYARLKKVNAGGPELLHGLPPVPPIPVKAFRELAESSNTVILDTRSILAFAGGHIRGAINIGPRDELAVWAADMLDPDASILLVLEHDRELEHIVTLLMRTNVTNLAGYLAGSMKAWETQGYPLAEMCPISVQELHDHSEHLIPLDVRKPSEWESGHVPNAIHYHIGDMRNEITELDRGDKYAVYCDSGYRASIAASILQAKGFRHVHTVPGSISGWKAAGYELVNI